LLMSFSLIIFAACKTQNYLHSLNHERMQSQNKVNTSSIIILAGRSAISISFPFLFAGANMSRPRRSPTEYRGLFTGAHGSSTVLRGWLKLLRQSLTVARGSVKVLRESVTVAPGSITVLRRSFTVARDSFTVHRWSFPLARDPPTVLRGSLTGNHLSLKRPLFLKFLTI
jgi:hypothetical protein